ncbi:hypothetical protein [Roseivirga sp.]|uniref:hypothetical protein n=1 Tax=Roseivirga sp. TaxID=1964215 RepID=UPI003B8DA7CD
MKIKSRAAFYTIMCAIALSTFSCGNENTDPDARAEAFELLSGDWTFGTDGSIILDDQDVSLNYQGFSLSFADGTYQTSNAGDLFNASGTWDWLDENAQQILLDSGEEVTIEELSLVTFRFSFFHSGNNAFGTRGNYTVTLNKN